MKTKFLLLTAALAFTLSCSGDDGGDGNPAAVSSSSENADVSSSSEQVNNYSSSEQSESSSSSFGIDIENSSSSNITDISSSSEQVESSSSSSSLDIENSSSSSNANDSSSSEQGNNSSSSSSNATVSSSSERIENSSSSSSLGTDISSSSSEQGNSSSSSSNITKSSSSSQSGTVCASLNNYIMAVEVNLNGEPVVVKKDGEVLVEGVNYRVVEAQNSVTVRWLKDYIGSVERSSAPANAIEYVVKDIEKVLVEGTDYEVINTGRFVKFVGINDYTGSVEVELSCEPVLGYFGNVGTLGVIDLMADPDHAVWSSTSYNMDLPDYNTASGVGFKSFEVVKPGSMPITFTKAGYRFIALPVELGYPSRINDAVEADVKGLYNRSEKIIKGKNYIVYESPNESVNTGSGAATETIIY